MDKSNGKKILILGATAQTVPFIETAHEMGIITYVADHIESSPAKKYADYPLNINCFDIDALEGVVYKENIDGIVLGCADILLPCYQELCKRTGRFCYGTKEQIEVFGNKKGLKKMLKKYDMPYIPEYQMSDRDNLEIEDSLFPVFVKPVDNCSSKGMSVCNSKEDFAQCRDKALAASKSKTILVEKYMVCDDISITYTFVDGQVYVTSISDRYVNREQKDVGTITTALVYPSKYTQLYFETLHEKACKMFEKMELKNGVLTIQAFVEDGEIMFYDPAFRVTGGQGYIFYDYFKMVDQIQMLIEFSLTGKMTENREEVNNNKCNFGSFWAVNLVLLIKTGEISRIEGIEEVRKMKGVINVTQCHFPGDVVSGRGTLDQTVARMHLVADSKKQLAELIDGVQDAVKVYNSEGCDMLMEQFDTSELYNNYC